MTPQQLIETAQFLNAEKLKSRPAEALRDALAFTEALRMLEASPVFEEPAGQHEKPIIEASDNSNPIDQLRNFRSRSGMTTATIAKALGVHTGTLYFWLSGRYAPRQQSLDKIVSFLKKQ